jgi:hypothetical protein
MRWFVRASLLCFLFGFTFDALIPSQKGLSFYPPVWNLFPVHFWLISAGLVFVVDSCRRVRPQGVS